MDRIINDNEDVVNLQTSKFGAIEAGNTEFEKPVVLKNITENTIMALVKPARSNDYITTPIYPGWNPELIGGIKNVVADTLQYGR